MQNYAYVHVQDEFQPGPPCRFCDDPSNVNNKGPVMQTSTAPDGRPLWAHAECDNPFSFADSMRYFDDLDNPNPVDTDFIEVHAHQPGNPVDTYIRTENRHTLQTGVGGIDGTDDRPAPPAPVHHEKGLQTQVHMVEQPIGTE
jgi:hypothetical protein